MKIAHASLAIVLVGLFASIHAPHAMAAPINSSSVVYQVPIEPRELEIPVETVPVELYVRTDKDTYDLGQDVTVTLRVTNLGSRVAWVPLQVNPALNVRVRNSEDFIWTALDISPLGEGYGPWGHVMTLAPGTVAEIECLWGLVSEQGPAVDPGLYRVVGVLGGGVSCPVIDANGEVIDTIDPGMKCEVAITVVPEPAGIASICLGALVLMRKRSRNRTS